jgi:hypothetical protein
MKRKDLLQVTGPLADKLYRFAFMLIPDDLQAEQLVIDGFNAFLLRERKSILRKELDLENKKDVLLQRRQLFKGILRSMGEIGIRRALQLSEQMRLTKPEEFELFFSLDPKVRFVTALRYEAQFTVEEIGEILQVPRFEVIEKIHNGRFLLMNKLNPGASL